MRKETYAIRTAKGLQQITVEASDEAHDQLATVIRSMGKLRELYSSVREVEHQAQQTKYWLDEAFEKSNVSSLFDNELL